MNGQDFENLILIKKPCPTPECLWGRHYHHFVDDYYFCNCGWKKAGEAFVPDLYEGDDWDAETQTFIVVEDEIVDDATTQ